MPLPASAPAAVASGPFAVRQVLGADECLSAGTDPLLTPSFVTSETLPPCRTRLGLPSASFRARTVAVALCAVAAAHRQNLLIGELPRPCAAKTAASPPSERECRRARVPPHGGQVAGGDDGVRRQSVHLGLVEQQEERAVAADAVLRVVAVEPCVGDAGVVQLGDPRLRRARAVRRAGPNWMDSVGTGLGAGGFLAGAEPVVAHGALERPAVVGALLDDAVRAGRHAVAAAVADVLLDDDGAELGAEQRSGRADVEAGGVRAVLAHVRGHQPAQLAASVGLASGCVSECRPPPAGFPEPCAARASTSTSLWSTSGVGARASAR